MRLTAAGLWVTMKTDEEPTDGNFSKVYGITRLKSLNFYKAGYFLFTSQIIA